MSTTQRDDRRRTATGATVTLGGLAILAAAWVVVRMWRRELPDPVASHWGVGGKPNGFSSFDGLVGPLLGAGAVLVLVFGAVTWGLGHTAVNRRIGAAATVWVALFLSTVLVGSLYVQRGLADARDAPDVGGVLAVAIIGSLAAAVAAALAVPGDRPQPTTEAVATDAPRVRLHPGERAVWIGRATSAAALAIAAPVALLMVGLVVVTRAWTLLIVDAVVIAAVVSLTSFVVRVDRTGLTVRSPLGWPRHRIPLDEVVRADLTQVSPVKEFGGWGWRVGRGGRVGLVLRKGQALLVERTGGRSTVVTVDDAATAAGLLNALADRSRQADRG